ncbi:DUF2938 domain-containing protein [Microbulbifer magnicolonia]|uniref:DUF2938 domain-containing protein n=1 Tax=Microbulbifer magnicolonia TaxID=3109744 RepID=UPI002B4115A5|nr:DUF2938 domain-containing protein [Microbulbifer sp. GG15]
MNYTPSAVFIGIGATLVMDAWMLARRQLLGTPLADYGLVGRWFAHMSHGRFRHERIAAAPPVRGERILGWAAHYLIGIVFAMVLLAICGVEWIHSPALFPALVFGATTVAAPFLLMQPGMGAGIAASRTPRPNAARLQSLVTHTVFGLGLYAAALVLNLVTGV